MEYDLRSFLFFNELSQQEVADFLGVSKGHMSKLVSGTAKLQLDQLEKLLTNDKGWNTTHLTDPLPIKRQDEDALRAENKLLKEQLAKAEARAAEYWAMLKNIIGK